MKNLVLGVFVLGQIAIADQSLIRQSVERFEGKLKKERGPEIPFTVDDGRQFEMYSSNFGFFVMTQDGRSRMAGSDVSLEFRKLSRSGRELVAVLRLTNSKFKSWSALWGALGNEPLFARNEDFVEIQLKIDVVSCDGTPVVGPAKEAETLEEKLENFEAISFDEIFRCEFEVDTVAYGDEVNKSASSDGWRAKASHLALSLVSDDSVLITSTIDRKTKLPWSQSLKRVQELTEDNENADELVARRNAAVAGVEEFVELVKSYGETIVFASEDSEANIRRAMDEYLDEHEDSMRDALERINEGFGVLSMSEKLSAYQAVHMAYEYVAEFEGLLAKTRKLRFRAATSVPSED